MQPPSLLELGLCTKERLSAEISLYIVLGMNVCDNKNCFYLELSTKHFFSGVSGGKKQSKKRAKARTNMIFKLTVV